MGRVPGSLIGDGTSRTEPWDSELTPDPVVFIDAMVVKIRDGQATNRPGYTAIGVAADGERDILGLWVGNGGEGAKFWLQVLTEIQNRGGADVCIVVCDDLKGLPEATTSPEGPSHHRTRTKP